MQVKIFFVEKGIEPKIFGFENMMERGIRKILTLLENILDQVKLSGDSYMRKSTAKHTRPVL